MLHRTLVVANLTAQTPILLQEIERRAAARPTGFTLLVPGTRRRVDWTLEAGVAAISAAARGADGRRPAHVDGLVGDADAFASVKRAVETGDFDDVLISTLPKRRSEWLRTDLPRRVETLGLPVTVITPPPPSRDIVISVLLPSRPDGRDP